METLLLHIIEISEKNATKMTHHPKYTKKIFEQVNTNLSVSALFLKRK
jgi:hypothetical protein